MTSNEFLVAGLVGLAILAVVILVKFTARMNTLSDAAQKLIACIQDKDRKWWTSKGDNAIESQSLLDPCCTLYVSTSDYGPIYDGPVDFVKGMSWMDALRVREAARTKLKAMAKADAKTDRQVNEALMAQWVAKQ
jgi:hypothetical protein